MFLSLFLLANTFNLFKINLFNDEYNFSIDTLQIEKANALEINDTQDNSKIIIINNHNNNNNNNNDTKDSEKNIIFKSSKEDLGLEKKDSNKKIQDQKGAIEDDNNLDLKNTTTLQNTGLTTTTTTTTTKSTNSKEGFNFAAVGDWACTSKAKNTVKNIIDHDAELVLALGDLSYDSGANVGSRL